MKSKILFYIAVGLAFLTVSCDSYLDKEPDDMQTIANVLFTHHVTCENPKITRVIVCHPAMAGETSYPMTEQGAYIRLYGKKARILLEDEQRRR